MAIKLNCPRCKKPLAVPGKKAGSYAVCPACSGRFWVPQDAPADGTEVDAVLAQPGATSAAPPSAATAPAAPRAASALPPAAPPGWTPPAPPPPSTPAAVAAPPAPAAPAPRTAAPSAPASTASSPRMPVPTPTPAVPAMPAWSAPAAPLPSVPAPTPPPSGVPLPTQQRRTARLISADAAQSTLKLAADGKLPELQLDEDKNQKKNADDGGSSMNPLVLFGLLTLSVAMSIALVLVDWEKPSVERARDRANARQAIEATFFGGGPLERGKALQPYQVLLREASREHQRGNVRGERKCYQKVLDMLRAERASAESGLTGSRSRDRELERQLLVLLSEG